ncbi:MAG: 30S ribosomal protein S6 [Candidatus Marinimicrobia bacterium]|nr:30S ribosomal protein S6 [Candidatus Neomarinimicrobiota bacterium]
MKKYECLYIVNINYDSEGISAVTARVEEVLKSIGAKVANTQHWGKRKLAYAIDKERYGNYVLLHFEGEDPNISELHREFEIESGVLHYLTIRLDEFPDFDTLAVPQAYETERKRSAPPGGHRSRRYEADDVADLDDELILDGVDDLDDEIEIIEETIKPVKAKPEEPKSVEFTDEADGEAADADKNADEA